MSMKGKNAQMKTKIKPIVSWSIWAGGLSLVMGIVTHKHIIAGFESDNTGMSFVIVALFVAGLVVSFLAAKQLHSEWGMLAEISKSNKIPKSSHKGDLASVFGKLDGFKEKGETVDIHTAIETYHSKHNSRVRSVSIMAALVISMGLLGTVVGLIMSISGLGSMVENIGLSRTTMMDALKMTVSGMGTAFYTTFFGAMGGLILRAVAVSQLNSLSELCAEAAEYAENNLVAKIGNKEEELNQQVSKLIGSFENMQVQIDALTVRIAESIEGTLTKFGESIASVGDHAMEAAKASITGMAEGLHAFGDEIAVSMHEFTDAIEASGKDVRKAIGTVNKSIEASGEELHAAFGGLNETIGQAGGQVGEAFGNLNGTVNAANDTVGGSLSDFKLAVEGTALELNEAVGELHTAISKATGEMVSMAKAKLDTDANEIAGHLSIAAESIQKYLVGRKDSEASQKVA